MNGFIFNVLKRCLFKHFHFGKNIIYALAYDPTSITINIFNDLEHSINGFSQDSSKNEMFFNHIVVHEKKYLLIMIVDKTIGSGSRILFWENPDFLSLIL